MQVVQAGRCLQPEYILAAVVGLDEVVSPPSVKPFSGPEYPFSDIPEVAKGVLLLQ